MPSGRALASVALLLAFGGVLDACSSGGGGGESGTKTSGGSVSTEAAPLELLPPTDFKAKAKAMTATLTWSPDPEGAEVTRFQVFRNGSKIVDLSGHSTTYQDSKVVPGKEYTYEIRSESGEEHSERASATVTTKVPPLSAARLEGVFDVRGKVTSSSGFSTLPQSASYGWRFKPKCPQGSCRVIWNDAQFKARTPFDKSKASYDGTYVGKFGIRCGSTESTSTVTIEIEVTHAKAMGGVWRATRFRGTLSTYDPSQLGCVSSRRTEAVKGKFVE